MVRHPPHDIPCEFQLVRTRTDRISTTSNSTDFTSLSLQTAAAPTAHPVTTTTRDDTALAPRIALLAGTTTVIPPPAETTTTREGTTGTDATTTTIDEAVEEAVDAMITEIRMGEGTVDAEEGEADSATTTDEVEEGATEAEDAVEDEEEEEPEVEDEYSKDSVPQVAGVLRRKTPFPSPSESDNSPLGTSNPQDSTTTPSSKPK